MNSKVIKYGDNVDTDVIIPARYLNTSDEDELKKHCMEDIDQTFIDRVSIGDVIVGGKNFGCGSSREHAPIAIKASGISLVVAKTFARIFYRNSINIGLPIIECPEFVEEVKEGDEVSFDLDKGEITIINKNKKFEIQPFPKEIQKIINSGGLLNSIKEG